MNAPLSTPASSAESPVSIYPTSAQKQTDKPVQQKPTGKPDWLLIMIGVLFLMTLLIIWLIDVF